MNDKLYLLGGNGSSAQWWRPCSGYFKHYQALPIELPGFGENQADLPRDLDEYAVALLQACEAGNSIVSCGISSLIVLRAATMRPGHFTKIILLGPIGVFLWQRKLARLLSSRIGAFSAKFLLGRLPFLLKSLYASKPWSRDQVKLLAGGYQQCSAFTHLCRIIKPATALQLLDTLQENMHIVWGIKDNIADITHAAAWEAVLCRCRLTYSFVEQWGHYPYIEEPEQFVQYMEDLLQTNNLSVQVIENAHCKAGRLLLAQRAGIRTPALWLAKPDTLQQVIASLPIHKIFTWAIRGSADHEDQLLQSYAGQSPSFLPLATTQIFQHAQQVLKSCEHVIIQEYISVKVSGVAFIRNLQLELEWLEKSRDTVTSGQTMPQRLSLSLPLGAKDFSRAAVSGSKFDLRACVAFLHQVLTAFHYMPLDIEWGWNGRHFYLFQARPITAFQWKRILSSANIDELLPKRPSMLMENTQRLAAYSIPQIYALWDSRILEHNEPFTSTFDDASYLNLEVYLASLKEWGLPSRMLSRLIGAPVPHGKSNILRFFAALPIFYRMLRYSRDEIRLIDVKLESFSEDLDRIEKLDSMRQLATLQAWFLRLYVYIVQSNLALNAAIASSIANWYGRKVLAYTNFQDAHRVSFESDPASTRPLTMKKSINCLATSAQVNIIDRMLDRFLLPGNQAYYIEQREWFRDKYTRLYYRLHFLIKKRDVSGILFSPYLNSRELSGSFWQHNGLTLSLHQPKPEPLAESFILNYPGYIEGIVAQDILVVDRLDPGKFKYYQRFKAVIARGGGYLSHAAILLRELKIASAIVPNLPYVSPGTRLVFDNGNLQFHQPSRSAVNSDTIAASSP